MTARRGGPGRGRTRRAGVGVALLALALAGCAAIPTTSTVQKGMGEAYVQVDPISIADAPIDGDSPGNIVQGFIKAVVAGSSDNMKVARTYLTERAQAAWDPNKGLVVYSGQLDVDESAPTSGGTRGATGGGSTSGSASSPIATPPPDPGDRDTVTVSVQQIAEVDPDGRYRESAETPVSTTFELVANPSGQWRIDSMGEKPVFSTAEFDRQYSRQTLYFPSKDHRYFIPESRYFPRVNVATYVVEALLDGPSPWLEPVVDNPVPAGTSLPGQSVPIQDGVAEVALSEDVLAGSSAQDRELMSESIEASLVKIGEITSVHLTAGGNALDIPNRLPPLEQDTQAPDRLYYLAGGTIMVVDGESGAAASAAPGGDPHELLPAGSLQAFDPTAVAVSLDEQQIVFVQSGTTLQTLPDEAGNPTTLYQGEGLANPSFDTYGWVWTASSSNPGHLIAVGPDGTPVEISAPWLASRPVTDVRVARDGARIAVVSQVPGGTAVDVAAIVRNSAGRPYKVGEPLEVGTAVPDVSSPVWATDLDLVVLSRPGPDLPTEVYDLGLGSKSSKLTTAEGAVRLAGGRGLRTLYEGSADGVISSLASSTWTQIVEGGYAPTLPG